MTVVTALVNVAVKLVFQMVLATVTAMQQMNVAYVVVITPHVLTVQVFQMVML